MKEAIYISVYIFETLISYMYIRNKFIAKRNNYSLVLSYIGMFSMQYFVNFIGIPNLNLITFFATNFLVIFLCYKSSILQNLFNSFLLTALMLTTELFVFYISSVLIHTNLTDYSINETVLFIQGASSKLLYFLIAYIISKISIKEREFKLNKTFYLFILPVTSIVLLMGIAYITENYETNNYTYAIFSISTILLIYANLTVFLVHESVIKTQNENMELQLQTQKVEIDTEYYSILQNQYENSNILIHDIKRHLMSIKDLAVENDCSGIDKYIDNLYSEYEVKNIKKYSEHKLVNAIINRYAIAFKEHQIDFFCDIRKTDFSFISDNDLTAILDNLLENALEASKKSENKKVDMLISPTNVNYIAINLSNSCSISPKIRNGKLVTTKKNTSIHGYGIKSIKRIVKNYDGNMTFSFNESDKTFNVNLILKASLNGTTLKK